SVAGHGKTRWAGPTEIRWRHKVEKRVELEGKGWERVMEGVVRVGAEYKRRGGDDDSDGIQRERRRERRMRKGREWGAVTGTGRAEWRPAMCTHRHRLEAGHAERTRQTDQQRPTDVGQLH